MSALRRLRPPGNSVRLFAVNSASTRRWQKHSPMTGSIRSLPPKDWPKADGLGWETACRLGHRLTRGGAASRLAPVTQADLAKRYGLYLDFLDRAGWLDLGADGGAQVTP